MQDIFLYMIELLIHCLYLFSSYSYEGLYYSHCATMRSGSESPKFQFPFCHGSSQGDWGPVTLSAQPTSPRGCNEDKMEEERTILLAVLGLH